MHEMSIAEGIRGIVDEAACAHQVHRISKITLEIGCFAGVEPAALLFAFDVVMRGSAAEGAICEIIALPARASCYDCGERVEITERLALCPLCGGGKLLADGGDEMRIKEMEVA